MDIVDRIQEKIKGKTTIAALERELGLSNGIIKKWRAQSPSCDKVVKIANYLNVSTDYLILGKSVSSHLDKTEEALLAIFSKLNVTDKTRVMERAETLAEIAVEQEKQKNELLSAPFDENNESDESDPLYLDLYDMPVSAGGGTYIDYTTAEPMQVPRTAQTEDANYMVRISGDSMEPRFFNGDIVLVETTTELEQGEIGIFILNSEAYIKQLGDGCLISLNKKYSPILISENDNCVLKGRVIGILDIRKKG